jgi:hypothetical protein
MLVVCSGIEKTRPIDQVFSGWKLKAASGFSTAAALQAMRQRGGSGEGKVVMVAIAAFQPSR